TPGDAQAHRRLRAMRGDRQDKLHGQRKSKRPPRFRHHTGRNRRDRCPRTSLSDHREPSELSTVRHRDSREGSGIIVSAAIANYAGLAAVLGDFSWGRENGKGRQGVAVLIWSLRFAISCGASAAFLHAKNE